MSHVKLTKSEKAEWLLIHKTNAFKLLTFIALRAKWKDCEFSHLKAGWAFLGDYSAMGFTRKEYRVALQFLIDEKYIEIIAKKHVMLKKGHQDNEIRAIKRATKGTLVNILDNSVWDVICSDQKEINQQKGQHKGQHYEQKRANEGPTRGHKQEEIRIEKEDLSKEEKEKELPSFSSLFFEDKSSSFYLFENFTLANGEHLSKKTQNAWNKKSPREQEKIRQNMFAYHEDCATPGFKLKAGTSHESMLQGYINKDIAAKRIRRWHNTIYATLKIQEFNLEIVKVLKTVVQIGISKSNMQSISLELPDDIFMHEFDKILEHYEMKRR